MESAESSPDRSSGGPLGMSNGYKVRVYESCRGDGAICSGTVVERVDPSFTMSAESAGQATSWIRTNVLRGRLSSSRIYQICPMIGSPEPIHSVGAGLDGSFIRVLLDPASGSRASFAGFAIWQRFPLQFKRRRRRRHDWSGSSSSRTGPSHRAEAVPPDQRFRPANEKVHFFRAVLASTVTLYVQWAQSARLN
jgi:hypothetical protein